LVDFVLVFEARGREVAGWDRTVRRRCGEGIRGRVRVRGRWWGQVGRLIWLPGRRGGAAGCGPRRLGVPLFLKGGKEALNDGDLDQGGEICMNQGFG